MLSGRGSGVTYGKLRNHEKARRQNVSMVPKIDASPVIVPRPQGRRTRNYITGIHGILVLDETEAVHKLDLGDLSGAMGREVSLDIALGSCR